MRKNKYENEIKRCYYTLNDGLKVFFYAIALSLVASIVLTVLLSIIAPIIGMKYDKFLNTRFVAYLMVITMGVAYLLLYFGYNKSNRIKNFSSCGLREKINPICLIIAIVLAVACVFLFEPITTLILKGFESAGFKVEGDLGYEMNTWWRIILGIIAYALLPAVAEELVYRGGVQKGFESRCTAFCTIFFSTFCFTIMHGSLQQFLYQIVLGVVLASFFYYTKNILYSFVFHFTNNLTVVILSLVGTPRFMENGFFYISDFMGYFMPILLSLVGVGLVVLLIYYLRIKYKKSQNNLLLLSDNNNIVIEDEDGKYGLKDFYRRLNTTERFNFMLGVGLAIIIWVVNTLSYFR